MGDFYSNAVRHPEDIGIGHIRRTIKFDAVAPTADGIPIGALEAGAVPLYCHATVTTAFNGTTPVIDVGIVGTPAGFAASASVIPGTLGFKGNMSGTLTGQPLAANTVVYAKPTLTGATAGAVILVLEFINKRDEPGRTFPNNP